PMECCSMQCTNNECGDGSCLPQGSSCINSNQCCSPNVCSGGHCGMPIDTPNCPLDPGGTPCSQCIVNACCNQTVNCLNDFTCASEMGCFQQCVLSNTPPAQCQSMCCTGMSCSAWSSCVTNNCSNLCFP
ncbi:MAG: hypothetical protein RIF41_35590, partial [Polyangiaceae bacterium]